MTIETMVDPIEYLKEVGFEWKEHFDYHINNSRSTIEEYLLIKKYDFTTSIPPNSIKIYLDLNIWIFFRDVYLGRKVDNPKWIDIYQKAIYLNEFYDVYFIAIPNIFLELQKQNSVKDFSTLLNIIGKLSKELTIENPMQLVFDETLLCLIDLLNSNYKHFDSNNYQWDKASAILGMPLLKVRDGNKARIAIGKTLVDAAYQISFRDFYRLFGKDDQIKTKFQAVADRLNLDLANKRGVQTKNFEELYNEEFQGVIEASSEIINYALCQFMKEYYNVDYINIEQIKEKGLLNLFPNLFRLGKLKKYFPSLQVFSGLHASVRYDKAKKFTITYNKVRKKE